MANDFPPYGWLDKDDNFLTNAKRTRMIEAGNRHGASIGEVTFGKIAQAHDRPVYLEPSETLAALERLVKESVHPYDGGEYEDGEWEALDISRAVIAKATPNNATLGMGE